MEWSVITKGEIGKGIQEIVVKPAEGQKEPTWEEWRCHKGGS